MSRYGFLWEEALHDLGLPPNCPHRVYRAIRAVCRLEEERELSLTPAQRALTRTLEFSLRQFYEEGIAQVTSAGSLPLLKARVFLADFRQRTLEFRIIPPKLGDKCVTAKS